MNVPMVGSQQPSNSPLETNFEMMEDMEENVEGAAAVSSSSATSSGIYRNNKARLELEVQRLSEPLQTLEKQQQLEIQSISISAPSSNATTTPLLMPSSSMGCSNNKGSRSLIFSSPLQLAPTAIPRGDVSGMAMRKLELCFRKAETYEGMAMVLNVSLDRLLTQVTEIDSQRRRESETREAQEKKIQVGVDVLKQEEWLTPRTVQDCLRAGPLCFQSVF